jgi:hypothetical protein
MSNIAEELKLSRGAVLRIISLLGDPDRNNQECLMQATELRRMLAQTKGSDQSNIPRRKLLKAHGDLQAGPSSN